MRITWSKHAQQRLEERHISGPEVEKALMALPSLCALPVGDSIRLRRDWGGVVAARTTDGWHIVSVLNPVGLLPFTSQNRKKWRERRGRNIRSRWED